MNGEQPHAATAAIEAVHQYHDGTKHHFQHFARSLGYLDWASQPRPFRAFANAPAFPLYPAPLADGEGYAPRTTHRQLFDLQVPAEPLTAAVLGDVLRHAFGLSAWKRFDKSRWSLRVNPSSGNLHPTEAYVVCGPLGGLADSPAVYHYAADRHALEQRCAFDRAVWTSEASGSGGVVLIAFSSIHWRESWRYGERAFRYCQHDLGHAIAAISAAAALVGWRAVLLPAWSQHAIGTLTGIDRDEDFVDAEREEPGCIVALSESGIPDLLTDRTSIVEAVRRGQWSGLAGQLSEDHVDWTFIEEIARATEDPGRPDQAVTTALPLDAIVSRDPALDARATEDSGRSTIAGITPGAPAVGRHRASDPRALILQRRSAVALDGLSTIAQSEFFEMLARVMPEPRAPWNALWWTARIHLVIFVHRVDGLEPGIYLLARDPQALDRLRAASGRDFLWEAAHDTLPFFCLARGACRALAARLSCDQAIAADGFFSLGMIADFDASLERCGASFYRHLFWESGVVGQVLYLEAEAAGARATGIGCFYDDPVHETLGLHGHAFQSLYHFTVGMPVEDGRLTTEPGYEWENR